MTTYVNTNSHSVEVRYRITGKEYNRPTENGVEINASSYTSYPFDSAYLLPGETANLGMSTIVSVMHVAALRTESPFPTGTSHTNSTNNVQHVYYRTNGKLYSQPELKDGELFNSATASSLAFDVARVFPKDTITLGDSVIDHVE